MASHQLPADVLHYCWDNSIAPRLEIESGDTVLFETHDASDGFVQPGITLEKYVTRKAKGHPLTGPIFIKGAKPGDVLELEILKINTASYGWTGFRPGAGLLPEDFKAAILSHLGLERIRGKTAPGPSIWKASKSPSPPSAA